MKTYCLGAMLWLVSEIYLLAVSDEFWKQLPGIIGAVIGGMVALGIPQLLANRNRKREASEIKEAVIATKEITCDIKNIAEVHGTELSQMHQAVSSQQETNRVAAETKAELMTATAVKAATLVAEKAGKVEEASRAIASAVVTKAESERYEVRIRDQAEEISQLKLQLASLAKRE